MKKYDKIMSVFSTALKELDHLVMTNLRAEAVIQAKKSKILSEAEAKAEKIQEKATDLVDETEAATKTAIKLREFLE